MVEETLGERQAGATDVDLLAEVGAYLVYLSVLVTCHWSLKSYYYKVLSLYITFVHLYVCVYWRLLRLQVVVRDQFLEGRQQALRLDGQDPAVGALHADEADVRAQAALARGELGVLGVRGVDGVDKSPANDVTVALVRVLNHPALLVQRLVEGGPAAVGQQTALLLDGAGRAQADANCRRSSGLC